MKDKKNKKELNFFALLPSDVSLYVLGFLNPQDLAKVAQVCKEWKKQSEDNLLWEKYAHEISLDKNCQFSPTVPRKTIYATRFLTHLGFQLLEILKTKKLGQAIGEGQTLQGKCKLEFIVRHLLDKEIFSDQQLSENETLLKYGHSNAEKNALFGCYNTSTFAILHVLAGCGETAAIKALHEKSFDINIRGPLWFTPLHVAVLYGQHEVVKLLIELKANKEVRTQAWVLQKYPRVSPMELAAFLGRYELLEILYIEKVTVGFGGEELIENIKDVSDCNNQSFLKCLVNQFQVEIETECAEMKMSQHPLDYLYEMRKKFLDQCQGDSVIMEDQLKHALGPTNYAKIKVLDFFIARGWKIPEWFTKKEPPQKIPRFN